MANTRSLDEDLLDKLPLPTASFFVLFALAEKEKHGYRIMQDIRELSDGTFSVGPATLYTTIKKLTEQSLIAETSSAADDRRRTYALTASGKRLLGAEFQRQQALLDLARRKKLLKMGDQKWLAWFECIASCLTDSSCFIVTI
jgi:DNA-binding PadR family transcriptional regulator